ncbi:hypothetical protein CFC21_109274 [Triticum aestivum]|uniref:KIB1-4 beta-propeller domain-containing protein n=2 Tax=Triticum aestivum TaxID=4565 RepID=A0A9R1EVM2_WHEAT|nr:hypothetical protein CFC21_030439 [Triticum aestivum]KAF7108916.1 hypothetical protein CFC21_109274 [Triticum aestivum]
MAPFGPWADLHPELLLSIADGLSLKHYAAIRCACPGWRSALPPPLPSLLVFADGQRAYALSFLMRRSIHCSTLRTRSCFVGSSNGCFAVASECGEISILNPLTGEEIKLLPMNCGKKERKVVFAPNPRPDDYTAVAVCHGNKLAYTKTRDMKWFISDVAMGRGDQLIDLVYDTDGGKVYCLTECGDVHVLHIPRGRRRKPIVEPLLPERPFDPAAVFAAPYHTASKPTRFKQIFICNGSLYQVWRNATGNIAWRLPEGGRFIMSDNDIFVLRYDPGRMPCWDTVNDLGGYSVFIGKNSPAVVQAEDVPGVRANCVYWIDERWRGVPMVFDMVTRTSAPFVLPSADIVQSPLCGTGCWYFFSDNITSIDNNGRKQHMSGDVERSQEQQEAKRSKL